MKFYRFPKNLLMVFLVSLVLILWSRGGFGEQLEVYTEKIEAVDTLNYRPGSGPALFELTHPLLVKFGESWRFICQLCLNPEIPEAEPWQSDEGVKVKSKRLLSVQMEIAPEWHFASGKPLLGSDVKRTIEHLRTRHPIYNKSIKEVRLHSDHPRRFTLVLRAKAKAFPEILQFRIISDLKGQSKAYGHYMPKEKKPGTLARNPFFRGHQVGYESVKLMKVGSFKLRNARQPFIVLPRLKPLEYDRVLSDVLNQTKSRVTVSEGPSLIAETVVFNLRNPRFNNLHLRQLLANSVSKAQLAERVHPGMAYPAYAFYHPAEPKCPPVLPDKLGKEGFEKIRAAFGGEDSSLLLTIPRSLKKSALVKELRQMWADRGVSLKLDSVEDKAFVRSSLGRIGFSEAILVSYKYTPGVLPVGFFDSQYIPNFENDFVGDNLGGWVDSQADNLLRLRRINNRKVSYSRRCELLAQRIRNQAPVIHLMWRPIYGLSMVEGKPSRISFWPGLLPRW